MNNINEMLDILALFEKKSRIYLEDIMELFSCSKRTAYRRIEEIMQVLPVEKDELRKSYKITDKNKYLSGSADLTISFIIYTLLISQAEGNTKIMLQKAFDSLKMALDFKNV